MFRKLAGIFLVAGLALCTGAEPLAWMRLGEPDGKEYEGASYHFLGNSSLTLTIDVKPENGHVLELLWGSKNDQRGAGIKINGVEQTLKAGAYKGFRWQRINIPGSANRSDYTVEIHAAEPKAAFLAAVRLVDKGDALDSPLPAATKKNIRLMEQPASMLDQWAVDLQKEDLTAIERARLHGLQANEALRRCRKYIDGWAPHCDPKTGLVPRNLKKNKNLWNGKDSAADNYAFMVLVSALTDRELYNGRMLRILETEEKVATLRNGLPADYDFEKGAVKDENQKLDELIFGGSEYVKDGLMPITEWLGNTPWSKRMIRIVDRILEQAPFETPGGNIPSDNVEVNGEMMQVLSRLCFMTGNDAYLDMACRIADYYLLGDNHPTRDATKLGLRDHNCELISGLTEVYAACHFARKEKAAQYREPIHGMLDDILKVGINEHGLMYDLVNPQTGEILKNRISDNWGYNYNGYYTVYLLDGVKRYREATRFAMSNLKPHYWKFQWQGWGSDGIADSVEGAINLLNREPDVAGVPEWIDANINRMLVIQQPDGVIEGWHGDGNYARTAIMWVLWKQQGVTIQPWRNDVRLGAVRNGDELQLVVSADQPWEGKLVFDAPRHKMVMKLPLDYPRINQFPEWFTVEAGGKYKVDAKTVKGSKLLDGLKVKLETGQEQILVVKERAE